MRKVSKERKIIQKVSETQTFNLYPNANFAIDKL